MRGGGAWSSYSSYYTSPRRAGLWYKYTSGVWMHEADRVTVPYLDAAVSRARQLVLGSDLGPSSLPRPPRLGALPAVPEHPAGALALLRAVPRARAAGGAVAAPLEVLLHARRLYGQAGGRHAARAAVPLAQHLQSLRKVGVVADAAAREVKRGGPRVELEGRLGGGGGSVGALRSSITTAA